MPLTLTEKLQLEFAARVAPLMLMDVLPALAVIVSPEIEPLVQLGVERPFGVSITRPSGRVSVKPTPVSDVEALGLMKAKVSVL